MVGLDSMTRFSARWRSCCVRSAGDSLEDVEQIGISRDPSAHLHRKVLFAATRAAKQAAGGRSRRQDSVVTIDIDPAQQGYGKVGKEGNGRRQRQENGNG